MTKINVWWNFANSLAIFFLWFFILFTYGEFPIFKNRITAVENKVETIDYHLKCSTKCDTIIINNYFQQSVKKK